MMEYKGYVGHVAFDEEAGVFHGEVINTRDVITFRGESVKELKRSFKESVDFYLEMCARRGEEPERPFSGKFMLRLDPALHRRLVITAKEAGLSLNAWIAKILESSLPSSVPFSRA